MMPSTDPPPMPPQEAALRDQIAADIAARFGSTAPYKMVQDFVRRGHAADSDLPQRQSNKKGK